MRFFWTVFFCIHKCQILTNFNRLLSQLFTPMKIFSHNFSPMKSFFCTKKNFLCWFICRWCLLWNAFFYFREEEEKLFFLMRIFLLRKFFFWEKIIFFICGKTKTWKLLEKSPKLNQIFLNFHSKNFSLKFSKIWL